MNYTVTIDRTGHVTDDQAEDLLDALTTHHAAVAHTTDTLIVTLTVAADDPPAAAAAAIAAIDTAAPFTAGWSAAAVEVLTVEEADRRLDLPAVPALVGVAELADLLEVSRQRASKVADTAPGFPAPIARLRSGPVWRRTDLDRFLDGWKRRPGRPASR